jgi:3,2-trans-enoyl-CoA isomerase
MVLCSSLEKIFCAGLDLTELYKPDADRLPKFWESFQQVYIDLYGSRLATVAAMGGHAPAAGCMLAMSCDYRIMSGGSIGLNESKLGIAAPPWLANQYIDTIGKRPAELALSLGTLYDHKEALAMGLIDDVHDRASIVEHAKKQAAEWVRIPPPARVAVKQLTRKAQIDHLLATREADNEHFCSFVTNEMAQRNLGAYLGSLKKKK